MQLMVKHFNEPKLNYIKKVMKGEIWMQCFWADEETRKWEKSKHQCYSLFGRLKQNVHHIGPWSSKLSVMEAARVILGLFGSEAHHNHHQNNPTSFFRDQKSLIRWCRGAWVLEKHHLTILKGIPKERITGYFGSFLGQRGNITGSSAAPASSRITKPNKTSFLTNHAISKVSRSSLNEAMKFQWSLNLGCEGSSERKNHRRSQIVFWVEGKIKASVLLLRQL